MSLISNTCLILVHVSYALFSAVYALFARYSQSPHSLAAARRRVPGHLSLLLTSDDGANEEDVHYVYERAVRDTMRWCRVVGIPRLSAYDPKGVLESSSEIIASLLNARSRKTHHTFFKDVPFPPTPPLSDAALSRPRSPDLMIGDFDLSVTTLRVPGRITNSQATISTFVVHILSPKSSIFAIAEVAKGLIRKQTSVRTVPSTSFSLSVSDLEDILEGDTGFPAPDLVIVHHCSPSKRSKMPLELHGFPPWQIRLSEIHHDEYAATYWRWLMPWRRSQIVPLTEFKFRNALDEYASAEMRLGK